MNISEITPLSSMKAKKLAEMLNSMFGIEIDFSSPIDHLEFVFNHYEHKKKELREKVSNLYQSEYTKSILITESIKIYLKEIAPVRKRKPRRKQ